MSKPYLSVCAIFKDEAPYLREWIEFHRIVGVERFFMYDNDSSDAGAEILAPYVRSGLVEYHTVGGELAQMRAYMHALRYSGDQTTWMAFIDIDEFLFSPSKCTLSHVLPAFERAPAVGANWCVFGHSNHKTKPDDLVTASYTRRTVNQQINKHVKSIVQPARVLPIAPPDPHHFIYADGLAVNERHQEFRGPFSEPVSFDLLRVNHYWSKSVEEATRKAAIRRADNGMTRNLEQLLAPELNEVTDLAIAEWLPELRIALA
jgi:hypothetical protein